jgi:glycosyltransferase involved in cell wall biosynthesis
MNVVIFANCHGKNYKYFIEKYFAKLSIEHILSYKNLSNFESVKNKLKDADILIVQPVKTYEQFSIDNLRNCMPEGSLIIRVPFVRFNGFWQNLEKRKFNNISDNAVVFFPNLNTNDEAIDYISGKNTSGTEIHNSFNKSLNELTQLESEGDIEFVDFFNENYKKQPLFYDPYHPTWPFVTYLSHQILHKVADHLGLNLQIEAPKNSYSLKGTSFFAPISDYTANCLELEFDLDAYHELERQSFINGVLRLEFDESPQYISSTENLINKINSVSKKDIKRVLVITPVFNAVNTIRRTVTSVLSQSGDFDLYYHIQDGGSNDGTIKLLNDIESEIKAKVLIPANNGAFNFSWTSEKDNGMYDAIYRGIASLEPDDNDWITWINADDTLEGLCIENILKAANSNANVNWISGRTSVVEVDGEKTRVFLPTNGYILRNGLADGTHWNFLQQEGTFFTHKLWAKIDHHRDFLSFTVAGDWNLWRSFAHFEDIYQMDVVLANFHKGEGQLSQLHRSKYLEEIENTVSRERRYSCLRNHLRFEYEYYLVQDELSVVKGNLEEKRSFWIDKAKQKTRCEGIAEFSKGIIAFDDQWQYPAITEEFAFVKSLELLPSTEKGIVYIAFPWATLIDLLNNNKVDKAEPLLKALKKIKELTKNKRKLITVCQHILMLKFSHLFEDVGITDIFWSHKIKQQDTLSESDDIKLRAFPLFPVQIPATNTKAFLEKSYLYSFVGARSNPWYLTDVRQQIIDCLENEGQGLVIARDKWHYESVVYDKQVSGIESESKGKVDESASIEFQNILAESQFSLCPSGSGPNSIRLWESISTGSIPVILSDSYEPPGDIELWKAAAIFCNENKNSVEEIPSKLKAIVNGNENLQVMIGALKQLKLLYGVDTFVTDIVETFGDYRDLYNRKQTVLSSIEDFYNMEKGKYPEELFILSIMSRLITNSGEGTKFLRQNTTVLNELISYSHTHKKYSEALKLLLNLILDKE